jgi:transcription elongation factor Elf1
MVKSNISNIKGVNKLKKAGYKIIQHLAVEWKCPDCNKMNKTTVYMEIKGITFECNYCGKIYEGRQEGDH